MFSNQHPFIGNVDWKHLTFGKVEVDPLNKRQTVSIALNGRHPCFTLCKDETAMLETRFGLDVPEEAGKETRRGQMAWVRDTEVKESLEALDALILAEAHKNSKTWFKAQLSEEVIKSRFKPCVRMLKDTDEHPVLKFKVKCPPAKVPTSIFRPKSGIKVDGKMEYEQCDHSVLEYRGAHVYPIVTMLDVWFMSGGSSFGVSLQAEKMLAHEGVKPDPLSVFHTRDPIYITSRRDEEGSTSEPTRDHHVPELTEDIQVDLGGAVAS